MIQYFMERPLLKDLKHEDLNVSLIYKKLHKKILSQKNNKMENQNQKSQSQTTQTCITYTLNVVIDYEPDIFDEIQEAIDQSNSRSDYNEDFDNSAR